MKELDKVMDMIQQKMLEISETGHKNIENDTYPKPQEVLVEIGKMQAYVEIMEYVMELKENGKN